MFRHTSDHRKAGGQGKRTKFWWWAWGRTRRAGVPALTGWSFPWRGGGKRDARGTARWKRALRCSGVAPPNVARASPPAVPRASRLPRPPQRRRTPPTEPLPRTSFLDAFALAGGASKNPPRAPREIFPADFQNGISLSASLARASEACREKWSHRVSANDLRRRTQTCNRIRQI